jgi:hypothetical protein
MCRPSQQLVQLACSLEQGDFRKAAQGLTISLIAPTVYVEIALQHVLERPAFLGVSGQMYAPTATADFLVMCFIIEHDSKAQKSIQRRVSKTDNPATPHVSTRQRDASRLQQNGECQPFRGYVLQLATRIAAWP